MIYQLLTLTLSTPDIMRHYASLIVRAETEIFLATNYWEPSHAAAIISDALRELSRRRVSAKKPKVIVKLMYDRGTPSQAIKNHAKVGPDGWDKVKLPKKEELEGVDLEVINYHRPIVGQSISIFDIPNRSSCHFMLRCHLSSCFYFPSLTPHYQKGTFHAKYAI